MTRHGSFVLAGLAGLAVIVAACGGTATPDSPDGTATPAPVATDVAPSVDASALVLPSFDPSQILANLEGIVSSRISMSTDGEVSYRAVVVTKPERTRDIRLGPDEDDDRFLVIGDEAWMD